MYYVPGADGIGLNPAQTAGNTVDIFTSEIGVFLQVQYF